MPRLISNKILNLFPAWQEIRHAFDLRPLTYTPCDTQQSQCSAIPGTAKHNDNISEQGFWLPHCCPLLTASAQLLCTINWLDAFIQMRVQTASVGFSRTIKSRQMCDDVPLSTTSGDQTVTPRFDDDVLQTKWNAWNTVPSPANVRSQPAP
jgi:hypothetical protein